MASKSKNHVSMSIMPNTFDIVHLPKDEFEARKQKIIDWLKRNPSSDTRSVGMGVRLDPALSYRVLTSLINDGLVRRRQVISKELKIVWKYSAIEEKQNNE